MSIKRIILVVIIISILCNTVNSLNSVTASSYTVVDDFNRTVTITHTPQRIVSLAPALTEILFALGLENKVVGVTSYCDYPPIVLEKVKTGAITVIGGFVDPDPERIISLAPDLVIAEGSLQRDIITFLEGKGLTVLGLDPKNITGVTNNILLVGNVCGRTDDANKLVANLNSRMEYVEKRVSQATQKPRVYYEVWYDPLMSVGQGTWINELINKAGAANIFNDSIAPYPTINSETVIVKNPEIIIVSKGYMGGTSRQEFEKRAGWSRVDALKNSQIFEIDENIINRPGPRIVDALEQLALLIHPSLFTGKIDYTPNISFNTNSTLLAVDYNSARKILNFTVIGENTTIGATTVIIEKDLLNGDPIVFIDGNQTPTQISNNATTYNISFTYHHSAHQITLGGINSIPEFTTGGIISILFLIIIFFLLIEKIARNNQSMEHV